MNLWEVYALRNKITEKVKSVYALEILHTNLCYPHGYFSKFLKEPTVLIYICNTSNIYQILIFWDDSNKKPDGRI